MGILERKKEMIRAIPKSVWVLLAICMVGIFFRTYHFHDWLQFSPDQARDATLIRSIIEHGAPLPLIGPQAGNTQFSLGPLYYYFQYVSGLLFGVAPQTMAYPDVFFSVLAIPLLFFFVRKYFSTNVSLALTAIMSVSYFSVLNSRFASNPNSIPFFLLLFLWGLSEMMEEKNKDRLMWPALVGIGLGVGVQQHTLLLLCMPVVAIVVAVWLSVKKRLSWKGLVLAVALVVILNTGYFIHEWQTGGQSMRALLGGVSDRSSNDSEFLENAGLIASCELQANTHIISSLQNIETCGGMFKISREISRNGSSPVGWFKSGLFILGAGLSLIFTVGGYVLGWRAFRRAESPEKKYFLALLAGFNLLMLLIFIPVAGEVGMRYFIVLFFVPFVLLGLWLDFFSEKCGKRGMIVSGIIVAVFVFSGLAVTARAGAELAAGQGSDADNSILGEIEPMLGYVLDRADPSQEKIYITGKKLYNKRFYKPLNFLAEEQGRKLTLADDKEKFPAIGTQLFSFANADKKQYVIDGLYEGHRIESVQIFGKIMIVVLRW